MIDDILIKNFWSRVQVTSGCWIWRGSKSHFGHGRIKRKGVSYVASRISYELHHGSIPKGLVVCHSCDNPSCCNPAHLWVGTQGDNQRDCTRKRRRAYGTKNGRSTTPERTPRGESHGMSALTADAVRKIRKLKGQMSQEKIARQFGIGQTNVSAILRRKTWKHVP